jgi:hypothetical protein
MIVKLTRSTTPRDYYASPYRTKPKIIPQGQKSMNNQTTCNHRTPPKYNVDYLDDKTAIVNGVSYTRSQPSPIVIQVDDNTIDVNGVKYKKVDDLGAITLENSIAECMIEYNNTVYPELLENILNKINLWLPKLKQEVGYEHKYYHAKGWNDCLREIKNTMY